MPGLTEWPRMGEERFVKRNLGFRLEEEVTEGSQQSFKAGLQPKLLQEAFQNSRQLKQSIYYCCHKCVSPWDKAYYVRREQSSQAKNICLV